MFYQSGNDGDASDIVQIAKILSSMNEIASSGEESKSEESKSGKKRKRDDSINNKENNGGRPSSEPAMQDMPEFDFNISLDGFHDYVKLRFKSEYELNATGYNHLNITRDDLVACYKKYRKSFKSTIGQRAYFSKSQNRNKYVYKARDGFTIDEINNDYKLIVSMSRQCGKIRKRSSPGADTFAGKFDEVFIQEFGKSSFCKFAENFSEERRREEKIKVVVSCADLFSLKNEDIIKNATAIYKELFPGCLGYFFDGSCAVVVPPGSGTENALTTPAFAMFSSSNNRSCSPENPTSPNRGSSAPQNLFDGTGNTSGAVKRPTPTKPRPVQENASERDLSESQRNLGL